VTVAEALRRGAGALRAAAVADPELEAEVLLRHALGVARARLFARLQDEVDPEAERRYRDLVRRRAAHVPTAYLTGTREFYGLDLHVAPGVLIPRPETEHVVEEVLRLGRDLLARRERVTVVDVGTGAGAIALAVAKLLPALRVLATDRSPAALAMAALNARRLRLAGRVTFLQGDLLAPVREPVDLIAANLPYIPTDVIATLAPEVRDHEPRLALDGGVDGLRVIARLLAEVPGRLAPDGAVVLEIGHDQAERVRCLAADLVPGAGVRFVPDLAGHDRVAVIGRHAPER
jgi:release factor glutamine methyltransferase